MKVNYRGKEIEIPVRKLEKWEMGLGLMFRSRESKNLLFEFSSPKRRAIHSYFVFFDFLAVWIRGGRVLECRVVRPFTFSAVPKEKFDTLIEIPVDKRNMKIVDFFLKK